MPNLNDPNLKPVSFRRGGLTHGGQVHLEGTYAYLPADLADLDVDGQVAELGDHFFDPGIRRGFTPASESYLAAEYQRRVQADMDAGVKPIADRPVHETLQNPQGVEEFSAGGVEMSTGGEASPVASQEPAMSDLHDAEGRLPQGYELSRDSTDTALTEAERANADALRGAGNPPTEGEPESGPAVPSGPPWDDAESLNVDDTLDRLADASDEEVDRFIAWEKSRAKPRKTILEQLED